MICVRWSWRPNAGLGKQLVSPPESTRCEAFGGNLTTRGGELDRLLGILMDCSAVDGAAVALSNDQHGQGNSPGSNRRMGFARWTLDTVGAFIEEPEALAVPSDDGLGLDDDQTRPPVHPAPGQPDPEKPITEPKPQTPHRALEDAELMTKCQVLCRERRTWEKEPAEQDDDSAHDAHGCASVLVA